MKRKIVILAGLFALLVLPLTLTAQNRGQGRPDFQERMKQQREELKKTLELNKDQEVKFDKIYSDFDKKRQEMMESMRSGGDREGMREKMTKMNTERDESLKKILDKDQVKKYEAYLKKQEEERAARSAERRGDGRRR